MRSGVIIAILLTGLLGFASAVLFVTRDHFQPREIAIFGDAPHFVLTDSNAARFDSHSLRGKVWAINFFFTRCKGICPTVSASMARISRAFEDKQNFNLISLSIDPKNDKPEVLKSYSEKFRADTARWHFLTGQDSDIKDIVGKGFQLGSGDNIDEHSGRIVLVDFDGRVRGYYQGTDAEAVKNLESDIGELLSSER